MRRVNVFEKSYRAGFRSQTKTIPEDQIHCPPGVHDDPDMNRALAYYLGVADARDMLRGRRAG
jgi:hypothetical protein